MRIGFVASRAFTKRVKRFRALVLAVADTDPDTVDRIMREMGSRRFFLAPLAWAAGSVVLMLRGITLILTNWRLTLIQLVPAMLIWLGMYEMSRYALHGAELRTLSPGWLLVGSLLIIAATMASFWCNTVFAFAIDAIPPKIRPAIRATQRRIRPVLIAGLLGGVLLSFAALVLPRFGKRWVFEAVLLGTLGLLIVAFVAVPARILQRPPRKLPPREAVGRTLVGWFVSAVAMAPGFILDRVGLVLMGVPGLRILGFVLLTLGTALFAAGMSSVKAVKMSIKLGAPPAA